MILGGFGKGIQRLVRWLKIIEYISTAKGISNVEEVLMGVDTCILEDMNTRLDRLFTINDIHATLLSMSPLKASGEDGMGALFYQHFWHILGDEVAAFYIGLLHGDVPLLRVNSTHIVLIPKIKKKTFVICCTFALLVCVTLFTNLHKFQEVLPRCIDEA